MIFNVGGKYSLFEQDFNEKIKPLLIKLNKKEEVLRKLIVKSVSSGNTNSSYWNIVRRDVNTLYAEISSIFNSWAKDQIPSKYRISIKQIQNTIDKSSITNKSLRSITELINSTPSRQTMSLLYKDAVTSFNTSIIAGRSNVIKLTHLTQQTLISDNLIGQSLADIFLDTGDIRKASRVISGQLWSKLYESVDEKRFVQAGKYKYKPSYYAEMISRVKFHEAHSYATINQCNNYQTDLVQVSSHNTMTAICVPFEGKIYSLSGTSKIFPPLFDSPPYHPNCLHLLYPTFISGMETQGTLDAYSDFSQGRIDRPPVPSNFIPVDERGIR